MSTSEDQYDPDYDREDNLDDALTGPSYDPDETTGTPVGLNSPSTRTESPSYSPSRGSASQ